MRNDFRHRLLGRSLAGGLVAAQVAVSFCLVIGIGLLVRTVHNLQNVNTGFRSDHILLAWIFPTLAGYEGPAELRLYDRLLHDAQTIPGVASAGIARHSMMQGNDRENVWVPGRAVEQVSFNAVTPGFFATMGIPILQGRDFADTDHTASPAIAIVNQHFAAEFFGGYAVGRQIRIGGPENPLVEIIGVVGNTRYRSLRQDSGSPSGQVLVPYIQARAGELGQMTIVIRTAASPAGVLPELRRRVAAADPRMPVGPVTTQEQQVSDSIANERSLATLTAVFGSVALLMASMGLYGAISYSVNRRTREIGVRMALGANRHNLVWLVLRETLLLVAAGLVLGVPAALASARLVTSLLYGVAAFDPVTAAWAVAIVLAPATLAGYLPARRAARLSPMAALHYD